MCRTIKKKIRAKQKQCCTIGCVDKIVQRFNASMPLHANMPHFLKQNMAATLH